MGHLGGVLEASWGILGASWRRLGASWGRLGGVLGDPGSILEALWTVLYISVLERSLGLMLDQFEGHFKPRVYDGELN